MAAPQSIVDLVARFEANLSDYRAGKYNETMARRDFIDPFFEALGWDMQNRAGLTERDRVVVHEDSIKIGDATKAPDYCMRVGGKRQFFVEAKKPSVDIKDGMDPAFQVRRYAWSAKLPLSILTDFEEFSVYDCRLKPKIGDKPSKARLHYFTYKDFVAKWDEIAALFSQDAVVAGSLEPYLTKQSRGTEQVDDAFLEDIERWRDLLARNIANRNHDLSQEELNFAVQATIDRLVFLRISEDRGIEPYGTLLAVTNGGSIYGRLKEQFRKADDRYNSGLFHFSEEADVNEPPDSVTPRIDIDDDTLRSIIRGLYPPESPYAFSVISADILGQVYEQFLGKVIRLTDGHRAKIEEKPEVRKAGGVYYTPTYIVEYIVKNTVGKLIEGKTPKQVSEVKICDPACGSGSFLLGAYQYLLDWHLSYYIQNPEKVKKELYVSSSGEKRLATSERKRILLNNIFGVDIDAQAVEVTKLSLLLKVLEGETVETIQTSFIAERVLPDLGKNIKCGNSLVDTDYHENTQESFLQSENAFKVNAFNWTTGFKEIFGRKNGGFDVLIGNPPWGAEISKEIRSYLSKKFPAVSDFESAQYFMVKNISHLREKGELGFIVPNTLILNVYAKKFRDELVNNSSITQILDLSELDVFSDASVRSTIIHLRKEKDIECVVFKAHNSFSILNVANLSQEKLKNAEQWNSFLVEDTPLSNLFNSLKNQGSLDTYCDVRQGYIPYRTTTLVKRFGQIVGEKIVKERSWHSKSPDGVDYKKELQGGDVKRYGLEWSGTWVKYGEWVSTFLPVSVFSGPRILIREISGKAPRSLLAAYTEETYVHNPSILAVLPKTGSKLPPKCILGVLNSKLMSAMFMHFAPKAKKGLFPKVLITDAKRLPFPKEENIDVSVAVAIEKAVEKLIGLRNDPQRGNQMKKNFFENQIDSIEHQIDKLVYDFYKLNSEEIEIVENSLSKNITVADVSEVTP